MAFELGEQRSGIVSGKAAKLEIERAMVRHDVERSAAANDSGMHSAVADVETAVEWPAVAMPASHPLEEGDCLGSRFHRVHPAGRVGGVRGLSAHRAAIASLSLVGDDRLHHRRLSYDARLRTDAGTRQVLDHAAHAHAAHFLVIGAREMQRQREATLHEFRHESQGNRDKALHVRGAAAIEPPVPFAKSERVGIPGLSFHRNDVGVTGERDTRAVARTQRDEKIGLAPRVVVGETKLRLERP